MNNLILHTIFPPENINVETVNNNNWFYNGHNRFQQELTQTVQSVTLLPNDICNLMFGI